MTLTFCSFAHDGSNRCTVVILPNHYRSQMEAYAAARPWLEGTDGRVPDGQFISWQIPDELTELYAPQVGRAIDGEEARRLFEAKSLGEWLEDEQKETIN